MSSSNCCFLTCIQSAFTFPLIPIYWGYSSHWHHLIMQIRSRFCNPVIPHLSSAFRASFPFSQGSGHFLFLSIFLSCLLSNSSLFQVGAFAFLTLLTPEILFPRVFLLCLYLIFFPFFRWTLISLDKFSLMAFSSHSSRLFFNSSSDYILSIKVTNYTLKIISWLLFYCFLQTNL